MQGSDRKMEKFKPKNKNNKRILNQGNPHRSKRKSKEHELEELQYN